MKTKKCKGCGELYEKEPGHESFRNWCSIDCAIKIHNKKKSVAQEKRLKKAKSEFKAETKRRKEAIRTRSEWVKLLTKEFNAYIRLRDHDKPCITCNQFEAEPIQGCLWDCGHFLGVGAYPGWTRFNEDNAHREHSRCNRGAAISGANEASHQEKYEANLRARIGDERVDRLKNKANERVKLEIYEIEQLICHYKKQVKRLKSNQSPG